MALRKNNPWAWIPTLYIAEGLPFVTVTTIALVMYKRLGLSNAEITFYTSLIALPWIIKPLWTPFVESIGTKRKWNIVLQLLMTLCLLGVGYAVSNKDFVGLSLGCFWALAFCSATHSISSNSYYLVHAGHPRIKWLDHLRQGFFQLSGLAGTGLMVMLAGGLETYHRNHIRQSWSTTFFILAGVFGALFLYHLFFLPRSKDDKPSVLHLDYTQHWQSFKNSTVLFFQRKGAIAALFFLVFFRLPEALLTKISPLFLMDNPSKGGLGLSTQELGFTSGTVGVIALALGGFLGAKAVARKGFGKCFWPMVLMVTVPDILYVILCWFHIENFAVINLFIFIEQFGCGYGFIPYMLFIPYLTRDKSKATHHALYTAIMALSLHVPGFIAGLLQEKVGYDIYFLIVLGCCLITFAVSAGIKVDADYGRK